MSYDVPLGEQSGEGVAAFRFRPDGSSSGGKVTFSGHGQTASINVDWLTGRTHVDWGR